MFGVDYFNGQDGTNGLDGLDAVMDSSYLDSLVQAYFSTNGMGGGCNYSFPDGLEGEIVSLNIPSANSYTVPEGKTLYINNLLLEGFNISIDNEVIAVGFYSFPGSGSIEGNSLYQPIVVGAGSVLASSAPSDSQIQVNGFLADEGVEVKSFNVTTSNSYTVPEGKNLYITNLYVSLQYQILIDGQAIAYGPFNQAVFNGEGRSLTQPILVGSGSVLTSNNDFDYEAQVNGYLVDEGYFAGCGSGGSSATTTTTTTLDSTAVADMIAGMGMGGGCNFKYPDGFDGEPLSVSYSSSQPYIVPSGKRFYVLQKNNSNTLIRNDNQITSVTTPTMPIILDENDIITNAMSVSGTDYITGILFNINNTNINPVSVSYSSSQPYIVPSGKRFYVLQKNNSNTLIRNDNQITSVTTPTMPIILDENDIITNAMSVSGTDYMTGYLADEDYFAGCGGGGGGGGGGSSSTPVLNNETVILDLSNFSRSWIVTQ